MRTRVIITTVTYDPGIEAADRYADEFQEWITDEVGTARLLGYLHDATAEVMDIEPD